MSYSLKQETNAHTSKEKQNLSCNTHMPGAWTEAHRAPFDSILWGCGHTGSVQRHVIELFSLLLGKKLFSSGFTENRNRKKIQCIHKQTDAFRGILGPNTLVWVPYYRSVDGWGDKKKKKLYKSYLSCMGTVRASLGILTRMWLQQLRYQLEIKHNSV